MGVLCCLCRLSLLPKYYVHATSSSYKLPMTICRSKADHNSLPRQAKAMLLCSKKMPDAKERARTTFYRTSFQTMPYLPFSPSNLLLYSTPGIPPCCSTPGGTWPGSLFSSTIRFSCIFPRSVSTIVLCRRRWLFRCGLFYARTNRCFDGPFGAPLSSHALDSSNLVVMMSILEKQYCTIKESWPFPCVCPMQLSLLIEKFVFWSRGADAYSYGAVLRKSLAVGHIFTRLSEKRVMPHISYC